MSPRDSAFPYKGIEEGEDHDRIRQRFDELDEVLSALREGSATTTETVVLGVQSKREMKISRGVGLGGIRDMAMVGCRKMMPRNVGRQRLRGGSSSDDLEFDDELSFRETRNKKRLIRTPVSGCTKADKVSGYQVYELRTELDKEKRKQTEANLRTETNLGSGLGLHDASPGTSALLLASFLLVSLPLLLVVCSVIRNERTVNLSGSKLALIRTILPLHVSADSHRSGSSISGPHEYSPPQVKPVLTTINRYDDVLSCGR